VKLNTIIRLPDGREGTICYHNLDGCGGVWGRESFKMPFNGFGDNLPEPQFMLREKRVEHLLRERMPAVECVGEEYEVVQQGSDARTGRRTT
jgi:hypothetical protein